MNFQNEKGLTLLEVLLSIVILTIILFSVLNFFPQMGMFNKMNGDKQQAIHLAKKELVKWQSDDEIKKALKDTVKLKDLDGFKGEVNGFYYFEKENTSVFIKTKPEFENNPTELYLIKIKIYNKKEKPVTETYGYISSQ